MKKLTLGLTFFASEKVDSIWMNGALQNAFFLYSILKCCPNVGKIWWINLGDIDSLPAGLLMSDKSIKMARYEDIPDHLDMVIEMQAQVNSEMNATIRVNGTKLVSSRIGNDYIIDMERSLFNIPGGVPLTGGFYDAVWTLPQHERTCKSYFGITMRCPVRIVPHIWLPYFLQHVIKERDLQDKLGYKSGSPKKRISVFEPNINVVKTAHYPMLICELAYRARPELFEHVYITCADNLAKHSLFVRFANSMDMVKDGICTFEKRYPTPIFLSNHTDVVLSHQWENELNYLYYDVAYTGYPLVHNSTMLKDYGYFYKQFDAEDGARVLCDVLENHDSRHQDYLPRQSEMLKRVSLDNPDNVAAYTEALEWVMALPAK